MKPIGLEKAKNKDSSKETYEFNFYIKHDTMLLNAVPALDLYSTSETRSNQKSFGLNYQKTGKELMSQDEITVMDGGKCIYQLRGVRPFLSDKFDITKHKNYKLLEDMIRKTCLMWKSI